MKIGRKPGKKFWIILGACLLVAILLIVFLLTSLLKKETAAAQTTAIVSRGNIVRTIEGSGVIAANDQYTVSSLVNGEILADYFEEGDIVEKDALLYEIDTSDLSYNLQRAESSITTARLSYEESLETLDNMTIKAPISGIITALSVKEGDEIGGGKAVAEITSSDRMLLTLPFLASDARQIYPGDVAGVVPENAPSQTLQGTVKGVASGSMPNSYGAQVTQVEILVDNPGGLQNGVNATATVGKFACNSAGTLTYEDIVTVTAKTGGTVSNLGVRLGDRVNKNDTLFNITSESTRRSVERSRLSYNDAVSSYNNTQEQLDDYKIKAPISGKVIQKTVKAGDKLESGSGGNASSMAIIADLSILTFEMSVDELDIKDIEEGQTVRITADAVKGRMFTGRVDNVSIVGTSQNGVTSYPVKVVLDGEENADLIPGMNVSATIVIEEKTQVLRIPAGAVSRGNLVAVKGEAPKSTAAPSASPSATPFAAPPAGKDFPAFSPETEAGKPVSPSFPARPEGSEETAPKEEQTSSPRQDISLQAPEGFYYVRIETGVTDGTYIEVLSGLDEGDEILVPTSVGNASSPVSFTPDAQNAFRGMGGMSGGMPSGMGGMGGGMPSGMGGMRP